MDKFVSAILKHNRLIVIIFLIATLISLFASTFVKINYDVLDYLPDTAPSTVALDVMNEQYKKGIPNARVMAENVTVPEALELKEKISKVDGVREITWLDDSINVYQPLEYAEKKTVEEYYKDKNALFTVTVDSAKQEEALDEIKNIIGLDRYAMSGTAVNIATAIELTDKEIKKILVFVIILVLLILMCATTSYFEPFLFLITIGIAILLNRGTNLILGEISFISNAAGSVLQLAVSIDYSIFLVHRFAEERTKYDDVHKAMAEAVKSSFSSILSSGLTTIIGFAALILMNFKIGPDMGIVMAKGIVISLFTVLMFLPSATLLTYKFIDKTQHKLIAPHFDRFGDFLSKHRHTVIVIFIVITIPCYLAQKSNDFIYGATGVYGEGTKLGDDTTLIEDIFGKSNLMVVMVPRGNPSTQKDLSKELLSEERVTSVVSYSETAGVTIPEEFLSKDTISQLVSDKYTRFVITSKIDAEGDKAFETVDKIKEITNKHYGDNYLILGESVNTYDLKNTVLADNTRVNFVSILAIAVILLLNFKSIAIPVILLMTIESSIWINLSIPYFMEDKLFFIGYLIISSIQLGATVDYAILFADRYLINRQTKMKIDAAAQTVSETSLSIITSSVILTSAGLFLGFFSSNRIISQLGILVGRGGFLSGVLVLFVAPALIVTFDKVMEKTTMNVKFFKGERIDENEKVK